VAKRRRWAAARRAWVALAVLALAGCAPPKQAHDCQQLLGEEKYAQVLEDCENPELRASAYLGLAGFDLFQFIDSTAPPGSVVGLLGLTPANIDAKRAYLVNAVEEVRNPRTGPEAFALLVSSFLGLATAVEDFLDNGADGAATALDDTITQDEVDAATGMTFNGTATLNVFPAPTGHFATVVNGAPYTMVCGDLPTPLCDDTTGTLTQVYDDPDGDGILDTSSPNPAVIPDLSTAAPVGLVVQLGDLALPFSLDPVRTVEMEAFLGFGGTADFPVGVFGYLGLLDDALAYLGGAQSDLAEGIDALRDQLDNGGTCLPTLDPVNGASAETLLDILYDIYAAAAGTALNPATGETDYSAWNVVAGLDLSGVGGPATIASTDFVFAPTPIGFKFLYPTADGLGGYDDTQATPRVGDGFTYPATGSLAAFAEEFENIPRLAPAAATAGDGRVSFVELLCAADTP